MYLERIEGAYFEHPFWRRSFLLSSAQDIQRLRDSGVAEVWIDIAKGDDLPAPQPDLPAPRRDATPPPAAPAATPAAPAPAPEARRGGTSAGTPIQRAGAIKRKAKEHVTQLFQDARMGRAIDAESCLPLVDEINESVHADPGAFIGLVRLKSRDEYTYLHSVAVCALMMGLAREMKLPLEQTRRLGLAGLLHDVGKAQMPLDVLNKPGALTDEEFAIMKTHPERGHELLLAGARYDEMAGDVCLHHHERYDGTGYPHRLAGEGISLAARMGAVCDVYDAITSSRPYKAAWEPSESLARMRQWNGHFDPQIFQAFVKTVGIYPVGSLVRLQSQRLAVVVEQGRESLLTPRVRAFFSLRSNLKTTPVDVDLAKAQDKIVSIESAEAWGLGNVEALWAQA